MDTKTYPAYSAYVAAAAGFLYAVSFVVLQNPFLSALFLLLGGFAAVPVFVVLYNRLRSADHVIAQIALILGILGAAGTIMHGGFDLANALHPPSVLSTDVPNQADPRGLLTFGLTGIALIKIAWLMAKSKAFPNKLASLGYGSGILLVIIYLARLIILDPSNPLLLYPVLIEGFIVNPLWYVWVGSALQRSA